MTRYIMNCAPDEIQAAVLALDYTRNRMPHDTAIIQMAGILFLCRRTKSGFSVTSEHKSEVPPR